MSKKTTHDGHRDRLRERVKKGGLDVLSDHEVIELCLTHGIPRGDVNEVAHRLLAEHGSLSAVLDAQPEDLMRIKGIGEISAFWLTIIPQLARRYMINRLEPKPLLTTSSKVGEYASALYIGVKAETIYLLCLDGRCALRRAIKIAEGTAKSVPLDMQKLVGEAIRANAQNCILMHNHPAGSLQPTREDIELTEQAINALKTVKIQLLDHIIVSEHGFFSFVSNNVMERGFMPSTVYAREASY